MRWAGFLLVLFLLACTAVEDRDNRDDLRADGFSADTIIVDGAQGVISAADQAAFSFTCSRPGECKFSCSLDDQDFKACTSPQAYSSLETGAHTFRLRARVGGMADAEATERAWRTVEMIPVAEGCFLMGNDNGSPAETPVTSICLHAFSIDRYEATNGAYSSCVAAGACTPPSDDSVYSDPALIEHPVLAVTWFQADAYCKWAGKQLPTEAQWEKAARGGLQSKLYPNGDSMTCSQAIYRICDGFSTRKVGSFAANGFGLFDMAGNAYEWVNDWYSDGYYDVVTWGTWDPQGPGKTGLKGLRGGAYESNLPSLAVSSRYQAVPSNNLKYVGFRCVKE